MELLEVEPARSPEAVREARIQVREYAATFIRDIDVLGNVELLASEVITNALVHGTGRIRVTATAEPNGSGGVIRVKVTDEGPAPAAGNGRVDHQRGLMLIDTLSAAWHHAYSPTGTVVWFEVGY